MLQVGFLVIVVYSVNTQLPVFTQAPLPRLLQVPVSNMENENTPAMLEKTKQKLFEVSHVR